MWELITKKVVKNPLQLKAADSLRALKRNRKEKSIIFIGYWKIFTRHFGLVKLTGFKKNDISEKSHFNE